MGSSRGWRDRRAPTMPRRRGGCSRASGSACTSRSATAPSSRTWSTSSATGRDWPARGCGWPRRWPQLPAMATALAEGELCWSAVRELTRVAVPATEAEWIAAARGKSMREVEDMVSGRKSGDRPGDPADPAAKREVLRLEVTGDGLAAFREARRRIELEVGHSLDDDALVRMLAHHALGGPTDPGRAAYQVAMTVCPQCRRGTRDGAGRELAVEPHVVEAALCDAQHIGDTHVDGVPVKASQTIPPRIRRLVVRRAHGRCQVPGCRAAKYLEIHHIVHRADGGTHDPSLLILVCSAHHTAHPSRRAPCQRHGARSSRVSASTRDLARAIGARTERLIRRGPTPDAPAMRTPPDDAQSRCHRSRCGGSASPRPRHAGPSRRRRRLPATSRRCCARPSRTCVRRSRSRARPSRDCALRIRSTGVRRCRSRARPSRDRATDRRTCVRQCRSRARPQPRPRDGSQHRGPPVPVWRASEPRPHDGSRARRAASLTGASP